MREIKFRAWSGKDARNEMLYDLWAIRLPDEVYFKSPRQPKEDYRWLCHVKLMQFTGLLDKQGKEIYEGDIVEYKVKENSMKAKYQVVWCEFGRWNLEQLDSEGWASVGIMKWKKCKVIGNIYENKELLK